MNLRERGHSRCPQLWQCLGVPGESSRQIYVLEVHLDAFGGGDQGDLSAVSKVPC